MDKRFSKLISHYKVERLLAFLVLSANKMSPPNDFEDLLKDDDVAEFIEILYNKSKALRKPKPDITSCQTSNPLPGVFFVPLEIGGGAFSYALRHQSLDCSICDLLDACAAIAHAFSVSYLQHIPQ